MIEFFTHFASNVEAWILALASSWWVFVVLFALCTIDGFFPPVPSESIVITLAVTAHATGLPNIWIVLLVAMAGAWCGDQIAYALGRWIGTDRFPWLRSERGRRTVAWAERAIMHRGASFILAARYVPIGRVAVNTTAGAVGYPRKRFAIVTAVAAVMWAAYSVVIGIVAASWFGHSTLLAMAVGVVLGVVSGIVIDRVMSWIADVRARRAAARADAEDESEAVTTSEAVPAGSSGQSPS